MLVLGKRTRLEVLDELRLWGDWTSARDLETRLNRPWWDRPWWWSPVAAQLRALAAEGKAVERQAGGRLEYHATCGGWACRMPRGHAGTCGGTGHAHGAAREGR